MSKNSEHNLGQEEGTRADLLSEVVEGLNPLTSPEYKAGYFNGAANKAKRRYRAASSGKVIDSSKVKEGPSGSGGGGAALPDGVGWLVMPFVVMAGLAIGFFFGPTIYLIWRFAKKTPAPAPEDAPRRKTSATKKVLLILLGLVLIDQGRYFLAAMLPVLSKELASQFAHPSFTGDSWETLVGVWLIATWVLALAIGGTDALRGAFR